MSESTPSTPEVAEAFADARLRSNEIEIDVLVSHELATLSAAGRIFWECTGRPPPETPPTIDRQRPRQWDNRTTDVAVDADDGRTLLIEDKGTGGHFEPGQVDSYEEELRHSTNLWTVLVAPEEFLLANRTDAARFSRKIGLENLAECLESAAESLPAGELRLSYLYRALLFRRAAQKRSTSVHHDEDVAAFGTLYQEFVEQKSSGRLRANHMGSKMNRIAVFQRVVGLEAFEFCHQLGSKKTDSGLLDCLIDGMSVEELEALVEGAPPEARLPDGFYPDKKGRSSALRCKVPLIANEDTVLPAFEEAQPIVDEAVSRLLDLVAWLEAGGAQLLLGRAERAIAYHFAAIATLAERAGRHDLATMASEQARTLLG